MHATRAQEPHLALLGRHGALQAYKRLFAQHCRQRGRGPRRRVGNVLALRRGRLQCLQRLQQRLYRMRATRGLDCRQARVAPLAGRRGKQRGQEARCIQSRAISRALLPSDHARNARQARVVVRLGCLVDIFRDHLRARLLRHGDQPRERRALCRRAARLERAVEKAAKLLGVHLRLSDVVSTG